MKRADIEVALLDTMGSDLDVVNAARVSFAKETEEFRDQDARLIAFLAREGHWSPFAHCFAKFRIKAPIFVARQLVKHQVGLAWNEVSRRYVDEEPEFYIPDPRARADNVKQGSQDALVRHSAFCREVIEENTVVALASYEALLAHDVAPEIARSVLPLNTMTEWIWSGSVYAFARVAKQRLDNHAQKETSVVAQHISEALVSRFPVSWGALVR